MIGVTGALVVLLLAVSALAPAPAQAGIHIPNPIDVVTGGIADLAVNAFDAIIKHLFAPMTKLVTARLIGWLVEIPDFTDGTHIAHLQTTVTAMAGGLLAAVATLSIARYWLIGYAGSGFAALEGLARTVAATFALAMWPWAFGQAVHLINLFTGSLLASDSVVKSCTTMLAGALGAAVAMGTNPLGLFLNLVIAIGASMLFLGLLVLKIAVSVSTLLVFVGMPLAIVVWPVAPWVLSLVMRAFVASLAVPVLWALCFACAAAVSMDGVTFSGGGVVDKVVQPLVALVLLYLMLKIPTTLARIAMIGSQALGGGFVARTASYAAGRTVSHAVDQHVFGNRGGSKRDQPKSSDAPRGAADRKRTGSGGAAAKTAAVAAAGATGGASAAVAAGAGAAGAGASAGSGAASVSGYQPPAGAQAQGATTRHGTQHGHPPQPFDRDAARAEVSAAEKRHAEQPVDAQQARQAAQALPDAVRKELAEAVSQATGPGDAGRRELAALATGRTWTAEQQQAISTLAAAAPDIRAQALNRQDDEDTTPTIGLAAQPADTGVPEPGRNIYAGASDRHDGPPTSDHPSQPTLHPAGNGGTSGNGGTRGPEDPRQAPRAPGGRAVPPAKPQHPGSGGEQP